MRFPGFFSLLFCSRLLFSIVSGAENVVDNECIGCGYTIDAPAPLSGGDIPRCADVLCLVQALLDKKRLIYVERDIDISGSGPLPDITTEVTIMGTCIEGTPCRIDANKGSQIFIVGLNGYLTLKDLELTGGYCSKGSAVTVSGSGSNDVQKGGKFVALNCKFTNNMATDLGAALNVESGGAAYIKDCIFQSNQAAKGGAVFVGSSKDFPANGQNRTDTDFISCALNSCTTFVNVEFSRNSADFGGAVYVDDAAKDCKNNGGAKFDCTTCAFRENSAQQEGGAVFVNYQSVGAIAYLRSTRFKKNTAAIYGGDIATQEGEYGTRGAQLYAYQVAFSESNAAKGSSVAVKPFSFSTFARCEFSPGAFLQCEGACDEFCPSLSPLSNGSLAYGTSGESCPVSPAPLCGWVPEECQESPPSEPSQSPSQPSPPPLTPLQPSQSPPPPSPSEPSSSLSPPPPPPAPEWRGIHPPRLSPPPPLSTAPAPAPGPSPYSRRAASGRHRHRNGSITGDPHFVGKHGERFDFHGKGGRDYCIVSDRDFHVNMHVFRGLHRHSTFISKIGLLYKTDQILIGAQTNKDASRFEDQWTIFVNKVELPEDETRATPNGLKITRLAQGVKFVVDGELDVNVTVRPSSFGKFGSGANYLDFQINQLKVSSSVHGILGQTYQETVNAYQKMQEVKMKRLKRSRAAALFMDGSESDYISSGIMAPDCKYSTYLTQSQVSKRIQRMVLEGAKTLLGINKQEVTVRQCTGFGHTLCLTEFED